MEFHKSDTVVKLPQLAQSLSNTSAHLKIKTFLNKSPDLAPIRRSVSRRSTFFEKHSSRRNSSSSSSGKNTSNTSDASHLSKVDTNETSPEISTNSKLDNTLEHNPLEETYLKSVDVEQELNNAMLKNNLEEFVDQDRLKINPLSLDTDNSANILLDDKTFDENNLKAKKVIQTLDSKQFASWLLENTKPQLMVEFNIDESSNTKNDTFKKDHLRGNLLKSDAKLKAQVVKVQNYIAHYYMLLESTNGNYNVLKTMRNRKLQRDNVKANHRDTFKKTNVVTDPPCIPVLVFSDKNKKEQDDHLDMGILKVHSTKKSYRKSYNDYESTDGLNNDRLNKIRKRKIRHEHKKKKFEFWKWFVGVNERYDDLNWERLQHLRKQMSSNEYLEVDNDDDDEDYMFDEKHNQNGSLALEGSATLNPDEKTKNPFEPGEHIEDIGSEENLKKNEIGEVVSPPKLTLTHDDGSKMDLDSTTSKRITHTSTREDELTKKLSNVSSEDRSTSGSNLVQGSNGLSHKELGSQIDIDQSPSLRDDSISIYSTTNDSELLSSSVKNASNNLIPNGNSDSNIQESSQEYFSRTKSSTQIFNCQNLAQSCKESKNFEENKKLQYKEFQYYKSVQNILMNQHSNMRIRYDRNLKIFNKRKYEDIYKEANLTEKHFNSLKEVQMIDTYKYSDMMPPPNDIEELILTCNRVLTEINTTLTLRLKTCGNANSSVLEECDDQGNPKQPRIIHLKKNCEIKDKILYYIIEFAITLFFRVIWLFFVIFKALFSLLGFS